jgi:ABC-type glutathione transport system ATPase component
VLEGGGTVLVDEGDLWPDARFVTTHLVVRTEFLRDHPQTVEALLRGQLAANEGIAADPVRAKEILNDQLEELTGKALRPETIDRAFASIEITEDPVASSLRAGAEHAFATGLVEEADLTGIYDLSLLREVLGRDVDDAGLGAVTGSEGLSAMTLLQHDTAAQAAQPAAGPAPAVRVDHVSKRFGDGPLVLDDVSLQVAPGEFVCLLGASGCGKSTLLNVVAGLDRPSAGTAEVPGGRAALMFQEPALFPWLTASANVELALRLRGVGRKERRDRAQELLALVRLQDAGGKRPHELSGGMRQRVAMARAWRRTATCC